MYTLIRSLTSRQFILEQVPALGAAIWTAELFYKFHSFILECFAFLLTWFVFDATLSILRNILSKPSDKSQERMKS